MLGTKIILIAAEISAILCAILLVWMICLGDVEADEVKALCISIFIIVAIMLQSFQQSIPWKQKVE